METTMCIKISPESAKMVRLLAVLENKKVKDIFEEAIATYVSHQEESLEILARPDWVDIIQKSAVKFKRGETLTHDELKRRLGLAD
ncbi:MAG: hypothetical protein V2A65_00435 [Candidatus Omnitrophota bacterium]